jgi:hypothetical protein
MKVFLFLLLLSHLFHSICGNTEKLILQVRKTDDIQCDERLLGLAKYKMAPTLAAPWTEVTSSLIPKSTANKATANWYQLENLNEGSNYEIRISYPAITPADFDLNIIHRCLVEGQYLYLLQVTANYTGVSQIKYIDHQPVKYNIGKLANSSVNQSLTHITFST